MSFALERGFGFSLRYVIPWVATEQVKVVGELQPVVNLLYMTLCPPDGTVTAKRFPEFVSQAMDKVSRLYDSYPVALTSVNYPNEVPFQIDADMTLVIVWAIMTMLSVPLLVDGVIPSYG